MARRSRRRGGEGGVGETSNKIHQLPKQQLKNPYRPTEVLSEDQLETIHNASLKILKEIGIDILLPQAREYFKKAGADVDPNSYRVRFDSAMVESLIGLAPSKVTLLARNPENNMIIGENYVHFDTVSSAPNVSDLDGGRRPGNKKDFQSLVKLAQHFNVISCIGGYPVEPLDYHPSTRHLEATRDIIQLSDKSIRGYSLGLTRLQDALTMSKISRGLGEYSEINDTILMTTINVNSPLVLDDAMLEGIIEMAKTNQLSILTPFTLAGAMAPVTLAGAIAQQNAECLAAYMLSQIVVPGAPIMYGGFISNVDMKSGSPAFGTPEYIKTAMAGGQLARRYGLPYRSSNVNASNAVDAQAAYESVFSLWGAIMGGANLIKHGAGWLEGGLVASFEKYILDVDLLQMFTEFLQPIKVTDAELGFDAIADVGPGGHFFATEHTQERYKTAFYPPILSDWRNFESWHEAGEPKTHEKANAVYKQALDEYQQPHLDESINEELIAFVDRRIAEGGIATDF